MAGNYSNYATLAENEEAGVDYRVLLRRARLAFAIVAPHGGGIEPGTSEIADGIAGTDYSYYAFEGLKASGNGGLHITSTFFDEPAGLALVALCAVVITLHGESSDDAGARVYLGGLDDELAAAIGSALDTRGFDVAEHTDPDLQGLDPLNICNRGISGAGVQLELTRSVRRSMFASLSPAGRKQPTVRYHAFVAGVRSALLGAES